MFGQIDSDDFMIAVQAAEATANRLQEDVAILSNFRVVPLKSNDEPPLEIVRYIGEKGARAWIL
jgi:hypothetical protein